MKKKNLIWLGKFLIEHTPEQDDPFCVWDLRLIFRSDMNRFNCRTLAEAKEMCVAIEAMDRATAQGRPL